MKRLGKNILVFVMLCSATWAVAAGKYIGLSKDLPTTSFIYKNNLFIGTEKGVFHLDNKDNSWQQVGKKTIGVSSMVLFKGELYAAGWKDNQAVVYRYNPRTLLWDTVIGKDYADDTFNQPYMKNYSDRLLVWGDKLLLINFPSGIFEYQGEDKLKQLGSLSGLPPTSQQVLIFNNQLFATGHDGFYRYDSKNDKWENLSRGFTSIVSYGGYIYAVGGKSNQDDAKQALFYLKKIDTIYNQYKTVTGYRAQWMQLTDAKSYFLPPTIKVLDKSLYLLAPSFALQGYEPTVFELDPQNLTWKTVGFSRIPVVDLIYFDHNYYALANNGPFSNSGVFLIKAKKPAKK